MYGEVYRSGIFIVIFFSLQVVGYISYLGVFRGDKVGVRVVYQLVESFSYRFRVVDDLDVVQLVVGFGVFADDLGSLAQADFVADDERVGGVRVAVVIVIELVGFEGVVVVESVRFCEEFRV